MKNVFYYKNKQKILNIKNALQKVLEIFDVVDIEVYDVELEEVIREMYAKAK
jgi:ABC-type uncharacterized transport system ATPase subunit